MSCRWDCMNITHAPRSDWLNSYGMLKPSGPNLRRSCTTAWKKASTKQHERKAGCGQRCNASSETFA